MPLEKQSDYLSSLLTPLCQQVLICSTKSSIVFDSLLSSTCFMWPTYGQIDVRYIWFMSQIEAMLMSAKVLNPEESPIKIANIQQIIVAINALSKVTLLSFDHLICSLVKSFYLKCCLS